MLCGVCCFFFNDTATTEIYTLSLHDALPICEERRLPPRRRKEVDRQRLLRGRRCDLGPHRGRADRRLPRRGRQPRLPCRRSEEHTSELQSRQYLVCRLLLEKKKKKAQ